MCYYYKHILLRSPPELLCVYSRCKCASVYPLMHTCSPNKLLQRGAVTNKLSLKVISWWNTESLFFFITHCRYSRFSRDRCLEPGETGSPTLSCAQSQDGWARVSDLCPDACRLAADWKAQSPFRVPGQVSTSNQSLSILRVKRLKSFRLEQKAATSLFTAAGRVHTYSPANSSEDISSLSLKCLKGGFSRQVRFSSSNKS